MSTPRVRKRAAPVAEALETHAVDNQPATSLQRPKRQRIERDTTAAKDLFGAREDSPSSPSPEVRQRSAAATAAPKSTQMDDGGPKQSKYAMARDRMEKMQRQLAWERHEKEVDEAFRLGRTPPGTPLCLKGFI